MTGETLQYRVMGDEGLEHSVHSPGKAGVGCPGGAESGAVSARDGLNASDLAAVVNAWATLPGPVRANILTLIRKAALCR